MFGTVVIQHIRCTWSKDSRGGRGASLRNAVPESLVVPATVDSVSCLLHEATYPEHADFRPTEIHRVYSDLHEVPDGDIAVRRHGDAVTVDFIRDRANRARARHGIRQRVFEIRAGEWGRLAFNGRYVTDWDTGTWCYAKSVYNVGLFSRWSPNIFVATLPCHEFREMRRLR